MTGWSTSTRRSRLPADWPKRVAQVKARADGKCQAAVHEPDCDGDGRECDHVQQGDDHSLGNLQWLSAACHLAKTIADRPKRTRPARRHPSNVRSISTPPRLQ